MSHIKVEGKKAKGIKIDMEPKEDEDSCGMYIGPSEHTPKNTAMAITEKTQPMIIEVSGEESTGVEITVGKQKKQEEILAEISKIIEDKKLTTDQKKTIIINICSNWKAEFPNLKSIINSLFDFSLV